MSRVTYKAHERAPLITASPAHTAGTDYSIDVKCIEFLTNIETPQSAAVAIGGKVETVLSRAQNTHSASFIWPDTEDDDVQEWLFSVAGGEEFTFDPYGTVAVPDNLLLVKYVGQGMNITRLTHGKEHWRGVTLPLRLSI